MLSLATSVKTPSGFGVPILEVVVGVWDRHAEGPAEGGVNVSGCLNPRVLGSPRALA